MTDSDARSADADELWARFEREVGTAAAALGPSDRAMLAVLYVAHDRGVTVKRARELVVRASGAGVGGVPSEPTISRHRERLEAVLRAAAPPLDAVPGADAATALRPAIGGQSYPAFCARLRRDFGLLWDALHLQRALHPGHRRTLSDEIATTVLRRLAGDATAETDPAEQSEGSEPLSPAAAARRFKDALAYEQRLPGEPGAFAAALWQLTAGDPAEVDWLAATTRAWVAQEARADPFSATWEAKAMLTAAWAEVRRARTLYAAASKGDGRTRIAHAWSGLTLVERRIVATLALLPNRDWDGAELDSVATGSDLDGLDLPRLVAAGWLVAVPGSGAARAPRFVCPPALRRYAAGRNETTRLALEGIVHLWRLLLIPRLRDTCVARGGAYKALAALFRAIVGDVLVTDCLDAAARLARDDAEPADLSVAADALRWMWRALADILGPSGQTSLHVRLDRLADELLGRLLGAHSSQATGGEWAGPAAERALIVVELAFFAWQAGDSATSRAALVRAGGPAPALTGGLLPPLDALLAQAGAERECLLTARLSVVEYNILLARDDLDAVLGDAEAPAERVRAAVRRLAALRPHLHDLERGETADEARKGLSADRRWNYPSLERWDRGRTAATYQYWSSMCLVAEARGMSLVDRGEAEELFRQAGEQAALATALYGEYAAQNGKWDRVVHALLHQSALEHAANHPVPAAVWAVKASTEARGRIPDGEAVRFAIACQLETAAALARLERAAAGPDGDDVREARHVRALVRELDLFVETCQTQPWTDDAARWARDIDIGEGIRRGRVSAVAFTAYLRSWRASFTGAVEETAALQPLKVRRDVCAALARLASHDGAPARAPAPRHRRPGRGRGVERAAEIAHDP